MGKRQVLKFSSLNRGMATAPSRMDLPPDTLFYAENVDLSIPARQGLLENDAMVGDGGSAGPSPDHNATASSRLGWGWLDGTPAVGSFTAMGRLSHAGDEYIYKATSGDNLFLQLVRGEGAWTELDFAALGESFDPTREPYSDGDRVTWQFLEDGGGKRHLATLWNPGDDTIPVSGGVIELDIDSTAGSSTLAYRYDGSTYYYTFVCVKAHTSPDDDAPGNTAWLPDPASYAEEYKPGAPAESGYDWHEYWMLREVSTSAPSGGVPLWAVSTAYDANTETVTVTTSSYSSGDITPSAYPMEYAGRELSDGVEALTLMSNSGDVPNSEYFKARRLDGDSGDWHMADSLAVPSVPASNGMIQDASGLHVSAYQVGYDAPSDAVPGRNPSLTTSPFLVTPRWDGPKALRYYMVYEHDHGGFSEPKLVCKSTAADPETSHTAVAFQVWADLSDWSPGVRRIHFFRVEDEHAGLPARDIWLFSVDRETSQWISLGGTVGVWMLSPAPAARAYSAEVFTGRLQGGIFQDGGSREGASGYAQPGYMGINYATQRPGLRTQITRAFLAMADEGLDLTPVIKGGCGLFSFVDYGQETGESASSILGVPMADLVDVATKRSYDLELVGFAQGRAFFTDPDDADAGTVYFSAVGRHSVIDPLNYFYFQGSGPLVRVLGVGPYILLWFKRKFIVLDARAGVATGWAPVGEYDGAGMASRDLFAIHENVAFWAGGGSVWAWAPGGAPQRISGAIEYPAFAEDLENSVDRAWMVVDPTKKELLIYALATGGFFAGWGKRYFVDDLDGVVARGKCLVYSLGSGVWWTETYRATVNASGDSGYKYLGKPFVLDGRVLIPAALNSGSSYRYLVVRQGYGLLCPSGGHNDLVPPFKRAVMETGYLDLGLEGVQKKLKALHAAFTGPRLYGTIKTQGIDSSILDHWTIELYTFDRRRGMLEAAPWDSLASMASAWTWDVSTEPGNGYTKSLYSKRNLPGRPINYVALRLVSQGAPGTFDTLASKVELGELELTFAGKAKV